MLTIIRFDFQNKMDDSDYFLPINDTILTIQNIQKPTPFKTEAFKTKNRSATKRCKIVICTEKYQLRIGYTKHFCVKLILEGDFCHFL